MPAKHANAKDVFPSELAKEIQKYYSNGYLWIPKHDKKNTSRKKADKTEKK